MEFLGDAILNLVMASYMFERFPEENEGFLTKMRTRLVNGAMLAHLCELAGLPTYVILSRQIEDHHGRQNRRILEDCFEAFIGAMFLDASSLPGGGLQACERWLVTFIETHVDFSDIILQHNHDKDTLSKFFQHTFGCTPRFKEVLTPTQQGGPSTISYSATAPVTVCVRDKDDVIVAMASATSKKQAENEAARKALEYYGVR